MKEEQNPFPADEDEDEDKIRVGLRLPLSVNDQLEFVVEVWNEMNKALGRTRGRRWSAASVTERFVTLELAAFLRRYGGMPTSAEQRAEFTRRAVADVKKAAKHNVPK